MQCRLTGGTFVHVHTTARLQNEVEQTAQLAAHFAVLQMSGLNGRCVSRRCSTASCTAEIMGRCSSVGIATRYGMDGPGSNRGGDEIFRNRPDRPLTDRASFPGVKQLGRGVGHPPHLAPRLKKGHSYTPTPPCAFMAYSRVTFTFTSHTASNTAACTQSDATAERLKHDAKAVGALPGNFPLRLSDSVMIDRRRQLCRRDDGTLQDTARLRRSSCAFSSSYTIRFPPHTPTVHAVQITPACTRSSDYACKYSKTYRASVFTKSTDV